MTLAFYFEVILCLVGQYMAWLLCVDLSTKFRASRGLQGASLLNALRDRAVWSGRAGYGRMW